MKLQTITRGGKRFVLVPIEDYQRRRDDGAMPPLPPPDKDGNRNAVDFARASIARGLIRDRRAAGLTQQELARLAKVRQETISRIESGKHTATVRVIDKIYRVIRKTGAKAMRRSA